MGISEDMINTIKWLYRQSYIMVGENRTLITKGVIQGGVLSPTLFTVMFNDLMVELNQQEFIALAYADDLAIVGNKLNRLIAAINIVEEWAKVN